MIYANDYEAKKAAEAAGEWPPKAIEHKALRLADALHSNDPRGLLSQAAAELRRLHEANQELLEALKRMEFAFSPLARDCTLANLIDEARAAIAKHGGAA